MCKPSAAFIGQPMVFFIVPIANICTYIGCMPTHDKEEGADEVKCSIYTDE